MSHKIYPIGIQNFEKIRNDGYFYIDKTALMYQMVKTGSYYFCLLYTSFIAQHFDKEHPHVHIAFNSIDNNGNTISDRHERLRSTRICKELTLKYGWHMAGGKDNVKRNRLKEPDRTKYALYDIIKMEVGLSLIHL